MNNIARGSFMLDMNANLGLTDDVATTQKIALDLIKQTLALRKSFNFRTQDNVMRPIRDVFDKVVGDLTKNNQSIDTPTQNAIIIAKDTLGI